MTNEKGLSPLFVMEKEIKKCEKFDKSIASDGRNVTSGEKRKLRSEKPRARARTKNTEATVRDDQWQCKNAAQIVARQKTNPVTVAITILKRDL